MSAEDSDHMEEELDYFEEGEVEFEEVADDGEFGIEEDDGNDDEGEEEALIVDEDMETEGKEVEDMAAFVFTQHKKAVSCVAVSPVNPRLFITGGEDDIAYLWTVPEDPTQEVQSIPLLGHTDTITSVGFNFNGNLVLTGAYDGTVRIWESATGKELIMLDGPEDIEWAKWHTKGNAVLAGSKDGTVWLWLTHNGQCIQVFAGHDGLVSAGCFAQEGKTVCTAGEDGTIRLWHPKTGACKHIFDELLGGHETIVTCLATQGDYLLSGSQDGTAKLFHIPNQKYIMTYNHAQKKSYNTLQPPPETTNLNATNNNTNTNTNANNGEEGDDNEEEEGEAVSGVECVGFSSEVFKFVATGGLDNYLHVWELSTGRLRVSCAHDGGVVSLQWHPTVPFVITGCLDGGIRIWDGRSGQLMQLLTGHAEMVTNVTIQTLPFPLSLPPTADTTTTESVMPPAAPTDNNSNSSLTLVSTSDDCTARVYILDWNQFDTKN